MEEKSLWKQIRKLSAENQVLKDLLQRNGINLLYSLHSPNR